VADAQTEITVIEFECWIKLRDPEVI